MNVITAKTQRKTNHRNIKSHMLTLSLTDTCMHDVSESTKALVIRLNRARIVCLIFDIGASPQASFNAVKED